jgi:pSer/pThr/pTyr-binding forkhead associated (FHA) protein
MQASLMVLVGVQKGREIPLPDALFVIGRDPLCHLRPHSSLVSRRHCAVARWGGRILVRDLKSANGTFLNQKKITNQIEAQNGDVLDVGNLSFSFQIVREECDEPPQEITEDTMKWLFEESSDSAVLDPAVSTQMIDVSFLDDAGKPANGDGKSEDADAAHGSGNLSGGKYLKDYLKS